jgi:hypothetical protein
VGALGKTFYKGGFEPKMNRREAALILQLRYDPLHAFWRRETILTDGLQRTSTHKRTHTKEPQNTYDVEPSRSGRKSILSNESQRGEGIPGKEWIRWCSGCLM